ncbi:MAG TPA: DUF4177 domain-containing protein [Candidatus Acidoferrum sp.]|nr:DUF4177 domain-containing protein [Candidatus Acidoferrum sp.]
MSDAWEYKTIDYSETGFLNGKLKMEPLEEQLNELGRMGWELVSAVGNARHGSSKGLVLILKRHR